ncbi:MAG: DUF3313 domain-containing protein [Planctomycetes bacterium]|nr:DUF3313 domain-containing protein [Planctomycetota bacterium]
MTKSRAILRSLPLALLVACRTGDGGDARTFRKEGVDWSRYSIVFVEPPVVTTSAERNEKVDAILDEIQAIAEASLLASLQQARRFENVTRRGVEQVTGRTLVCRCAIDVNFGSTALRMTVGFGAGRSGLAMTPALHDADTGELLLSYRGWGGAISGWGSEVVAKMRVDATRVANYFVTLLPRPAGG